MHCKTQKASYQLAWTVLRSTYEAFWRMDVYGKERIPKQGSFILAGNHMSFLDPPAFGSGLPRETAYFARKTLFKEGWRGNLLRTLNSIPVDRDGGSDASAFKQVFKTLKNDMGILLFPEGTRSADGKLKAAKKGVGLIACKTQVPVIPTRIFGSFDAYSRHDKLPNLKSPVSVIYGEPLLPEDYDPGKSDPERYQTAADRIMEKIAALEIPHDVGAI